MTMVRVPPELEIVVPLAGMTVPSHAVPPFVSVTRVAPLANSTVVPDDVRVTLFPVAMGTVQVLAPEPVNASVIEPAMTAVPIPQALNVIVSWLPEQVPREPAKVHAALTWAEAGSTSSVEAPSSDVLVNAMEPPDSDAVA
jgi:hypothetical protein